MSLLSSYTLVGFEVVCATIASGKLRVMYHIESTFLIHLCHLLKLLEFDRCVQAVASHAANLGAQLCADFVVQTEERNQAAERARLQSYAILQAKACNKHLSISGHYACTPGRYNTSGRYVLHFAIM